VALILLTNDDGIAAEGLQLLRTALLDLAEVLVVAPDRERSAVSHGLTLQTPLTVRTYDRDQYALDGTPADCIIYALDNFSTRLPDIVISGINSGANMGDDIMYSGTVAGAREASRRGYAALAVSQAYAERPAQFGSGVRFARALVKRLLASDLSDSLFLNINIPFRRIRGIKITRQGCATFFPHYNSLERASEGKLAIRGGESEERADIPLDYRAVMDGYVSITPLRRDQTDYRMVDALLRRSPNVFPGRRIPGLGLIR